MTFNYYFGSQAEQFSFVRIPRIMLTDAAFQELSLASKVLYGVLLDRMSLSMKNSWFDEENRVYIIYQIGEIQEDLGLTKRKAMDLLSELEDFGLLEKKRRGHGLPNILYLKSFMPDHAVEQAEKIHERQSDMAEASSENDDRGTENYTSDLNGQGDRGTENHTSGSDDHENRGTESSTSGFVEQRDRSTEICTSRSTGFRTLEVQKSAPLEVQDSAPLMNQTDKNYTYRNQTESNHIVSASLADRMARYDEMRSEQEPDRTAKAYKDLIRENIDYDSLIISHSMDRQLIDGIVDLILETVLCRQDSILIASNQYPTSVVKSKFLKLNYFHIEYVLECLRRNTTRVTNIRKYLLAVLFNAPSTMEGYYQVAVQHDMPQLAVSK